MSKSFSVKHESCLFACKGQLDEPVELGALVDVWKRQTLNHSCFSRVARSATFSRLDARASVSFLITKYLPCRQRDRAVTACLNRIGLRPRTVLQKTGKDYISTCTLHWRIPAQVRLSDVLCRRSRRPRYSGRTGSPRCRYRQRGSHLVRAIPNL